MTVIGLFTTTQAKRQWTAIGVDVNKVGTSDYYFPANRVRFTNLGDTIYRYLLFPAIGMKPLVMGYNNKGLQLHAHTINSQDDQPGLYQWRIDGLNIGNKAGYFIAYNDKDNTFGVTTNKEEAYQFEFSLNTYENNNLMRDNLLSTMSSMPFASTRTATSLGDNPTRATVWPTSVPFPSPRSCPLVRLMACITNSTTYRRKAAVTITIRSMLTTRSFRYNPQPPRLAPTLGVCERRPWHRRLLSAERL